MPDFPDWQRSLAGETALESVTTSDPASGNPWTQTVTAGQVWRVALIRARMVVGATDSHPKVTLEFQRGGTVLFQVVPDRTFGAGTSRTYRWDASATGYVDVSGNTDYIVPMPAVVVRGGDVITMIDTFTAGAQNWEAATITYERIE